MLYAPAEPVLSGTLYRPLRELVLTGTSSGATTVTRGGVHLLPHTLPKSWTRV